MKFGFIASAKQLIPLAASALLTMGGTHNAYADGGTQPKKPMISIVDPVTAVMSPEYKAYIHDELKNATTVNPLARPSSAAFGSQGVIDLDTVKGGQIHIARIEALQQQYGDKAAISFSSMDNPVKMQVKASDIIALHDKQVEYQHRLGNEGPTDLIINRQDDFNVGTKTVSTLQGDVKTFVFQSGVLPYIDKEAAIGIIGHETGHEFNAPNPDGNEAITLQNERRADIVGAWLGGIPGVEKSIIQGSVDAPTKDPISAAFDEMAGEFGSRNHDMSGLRLQNLAANAPLIESLKGQKSAVLKAMFEENDPTKPQFFQVPAQKKNMQLGY